MRHLNKSFWKDLIGVTNLNNKNMEDYQKRVVEEQEALSIRIKNLTAFTKSGAAFINVVKQEKADLTTQLSAMNIYSDALGRRIERFKKV